ncbi:MAG: proline racemase family protein, partial [Desulfobacterales bacterium]
IMTMLDSKRITAALAQKFPVRIKTIDSHTAGESTRLIIDGLGPIPGRTMVEKLAYFQNNFDHIRLALTREPRGHRDILAALLTEAVSPRSRFGLIYMDARRYPFLCGHATIGAVATLIEAGVIAITDPAERIIVDTPSGPMETRITMTNGRLAAVAVRTVPSFVYRTDELLDVPGHGRLKVDTVCVGGFFVMVSADQIGVPLEAAHASELTQLGMRVIESANRRLVVRHPLRPEVRTVDVVEFYDSADHVRRGRSVVIYGEAHMDRSPCGTGTAAKLTLLHHRGLLKVNQTFVNTGPLGTTFEARVAAETMVGQHRAVEVDIQSTAHIIGLQEFVIDPSDPFPEGFLL